MGAIQCASSSCCPSQTGLLPELQRQQRNFSSMEGNSAKD
jgi:hypothetical protein